MKVEIKKISKNQIVVSQVIGTATIQGREVDILMMPTATGIRFTDTGETYIVCAKNIGEVLQKELNNDYEYNTTIQQGQEEQEKDSSRVGGK